MAPDADLASLLASPLLQEDFPVRHGLTAVELAALSDDERSALPDQVGEAFKRLGPGGYAPWEELIDRLLARENEAAIPALARLWLRCPIEPLRAATARVLLGLGSREALSALAALPEDSEQETALAAVTALLLLDPGAAFERVSEGCSPEKLARPGGEALVATAARAFCPSYSDTAASWPSSRARAFLRGEPRWAGLFYSLREREVAGPPARLALRWADPALLAPELDPLFASEAASAARHPRGDWLARYQAGKRAVVWDEMRAVKRLSAERCDEALAVCRVAMARLAGNLGLLVERLARKGWKADAPSIMPLTIDDHAALAEITRRTRRPIPPLLLAFWEQIGGFSLLIDDGTSEVPDLGMGEDLRSADPLAVDPPSAYELYGTFEDERLELPPWWDEPAAASLAWVPELAGPWWFMFAGDAISKSGCSGSLYTVDLTGPGVDPPCEAEPFTGSFLDHLRVSLAGAGFAGLEGARSRTVRAFVRQLTRGFEEF